MNSDLTYFRNRDTDLIQVRPETCRCEHPLNESSLGAGVGALCKVFHIQAVAASSLFIP